jgi:hypothetical protein
MRALARTCLALFLALTLGCHQSHASATSTDPLARARSRAVDYLTGIYSPDHLFEDPYLTCEGQGAMCDPAFRELDHAVLVEFWLPETLRADPRLVKIDQHARRVLDRWRARWQDAPLDLSAIDLYALFPYYYPGESTRHMLAEVVRGMSDDGDWESYAAHAVAYRKVTDELWTVLALVRNHVDDKVRVALERKRQEAQRILHGDFASWKAWQKFYALSHVALLFLISAQAGYDTAGARPLLDEVDRWLAAVMDDPVLGESTAFVAEDLDVLSLDGYPDSARLERMARLIAARQEAVGRWRAEISQSARGRPRPPEFAAAHTTLIALSALEAWCHHAEYVSARMQRRWLALRGPNPACAMDAGAPPPVERAVVAGRSVVVGFPVTRPAEVDQIHEARANWENSVLFERRSALQPGGAVSSRDSATDGADRERRASLLEIVERAAELRPAERGVRAERQGGVVKLHLSLECSGPGATSAFAARAASAIHSAWTGQGTGVAVATDVDARVRPEGVAASLSALQVFVPVGRASPYTRRTGDTGRIPTTWPEGLRDAEIAHEAGHLLGFADEYHVDERGGCYYVTYDDPTRLMSSPDGHVTVADFDELVAAYLPQSKAP